MTKNEGQNLGPPSGDHNGLFPTIDVAATAKGLIYPILRRVILNWQMEIGELSEIAGRHNHLDSAQFAEIPEATAEIAAINPSPNSSDCHPEDCGDFRQLVELEPLET